MRPFRKLYAKEVRSGFPLFAVLAAAVVALHGWILYHRNAFDDDVILVTSIVMPILFANAAALGLGYYQLQSEWRSNSIYLLLSLPVRGWKVLTAKLAGALTLFLGTALWIGVSFALVLLRAKWGDVRANEELLGALPALSALAFHSFWICCLATAFLIVVLQFSYLCGQLVARLKWLVSLCAFVAAVWATMRIGPVVSGWLPWLPDIVLEGGDDVLYLESAPFLAVLLLGIGLTWLNGFLFEKEVEV